MSPPMPQKRSTAPMLGLPSLAGMFVLVPIMAPDLLRIPNRYGIWESIDRPDAVTIQNTSKWRNSERRSTETH